MARGKSSVTVKFGKRLGALRKERDWTFVYLSEVSGISVSSLHALEHGSQRPTIDTLDIIAKSFDMTMSELLKGF